MLTRLEVDGFKNLLDLRVDFGAFTCIAGANGTGKSNVFDVIHFLSLLADMPMMDAAQQVRWSDGERGGDPRDLFWNGYSPDEHQIRVAAEMLVPTAIEDDFGRIALPSASFLRYELTLGYLPPAGLERIGRIALRAERLEHINQSDATQHLRFPHSAARFRRAVVTGRRSERPFISTSFEGGSPVITVHQDGRERGRSLPADASRAPATVVSTITTVDDPTVLAARREMQSWRLLALSPAALRAADRYVDPQNIGSDGRHLAASLYRIASSAQATGSDADAVYARVRGRLADLSGLRLRDLGVEPDDARELLTIQVTEPSGMRIAARNLSEGTLRFLALCVLLEDFTALGVICLEEPENGIHPANLPAMTSLVRDLAVDPELAPGDDNPFRQVIVNTHSPGFVQLVDPADLLFAQAGPRQAPDGTTTVGLRLRPLAGTWRAASREEVPVTRPDILPYLTTPAGAQLSIETA
jgi:predicted ATPase